MSSDYYYDYYSYAEPTADMMEMIMGILGIALVVGLIALIIAVVTYVMEAIGIYTIAKRRGIRGAWLAWLPIGNVWMWGCIADNYQLVAKGHKTNRRTVILVLSLISMVLSAITSSISGAAAMELLANAEQLEYMSEAQVMELMAPILGGAGISMISGIVSIVLMVFQYIALYNIYQSCNPSNAVLFLVLSIIFGITRPFFIFFNRNKDLGIPAARQPAQPASDPWQQNYIPL